MKASLLCPGPSLGTYTADAFDEYPLRIGVNRAVTRFACHWWAALDAPVVHKHGAEAVGKPRVFTLASRASELVGWQVATLESLERYCPAITRWGSFTAPAALVLAGSLGATQIDVFGADWTNQPDFDGHNDPDAYRDENRWGRERVLWSKVCEFLLAAGVSVVRHGPDGRCH
jgi:hypothetical protein